MTLLIKIKNKKARRILEDLASLDIIEIEEAGKTVSKSKLKPATLTHFASEDSLAKTWDNSIEDKAWENL